MGAIDQEISLLLIRNIKTYASNWYNFGFPLCSTDQFEIYVGFENLV